NVSDGQTALDTIPQIRPDLILADISLPVKSGYEICTAIRSDPRFSSYSTTPIILLAGIYETMDEERARQVEEKVRQVQANDFLSKPFDPQLLITKVKQYLSSGGGARLQETPSPSIFAQEADTGINLFDTDTVVQQPNDAEKTIMLPGGPFGSMFASEPASFEEESSPEAKKSSIDVEAVKPVNEPIFEEENFPEVQLGAEAEEEENLVGQSTLRMDFPVGEKDKFAGREEQEFEYSSGPVLDAKEPSSEPVGSIPLILPDAEDPFADVFQEPQPSWSSSSATEEDSPFGIPEPTPVIEEPSIPAEEPALPSVEEPSMQGLTTTEPETFDDTWPGMKMRSNMTHPVDDLFESDPGMQLFAGEDAEELEPDFSENANEQQQQAIDQPVSVPAVSAAPPPITDELIDRIAERVLDKLSERVVSEIVWQVVPDLAEKMIRREIEKLHANEE
ncbi:MAG TPA: response regulator, partial [Anaerolineales bacterium]|nr:response regulator [Anaerolineales bacterium]